MKILLVHSNFPAQLGALAQTLGANPENQVYYLTENPNGQIPGVKKIVYSPKREININTHQYLHPAESTVLRGQAAYEACEKIKNAGFIPDLIYGHAAWGATLFLKDLFPSTPLGLNFEWYYRSLNSDADFDMVGGLNIDARARIRMKNLLISEDFAASDAAVCATNVQKAQFPKHYQPHITVCHEGIDTSFFKPLKNKSKPMSLVGAPTQGSSEIISYATRGMEPYRGFLQFMEAVSILQKTRPKLHTVIAGDDRSYYGNPPTPNKTWKQLALERFSLDLSRIHFVGTLNTLDYLHLLQTTKVHTYLTYPFVLSWSMLEAMSCETPLICSSTSSVLEVIKPQQNGVLVDFFKPSELAEKISIMLDNPKAYRDLQKNARKTIVNNYELRDCTRKKLNWLAQLAQLNELNP
jgi:glycosyltransferase involved in cell wall biosynthesis